MQKLDILRGVWPADSIRHTTHVSGMSVAGLCARFAPTIKVTSHSVVRGPTLASAFYKIIKWVAFKNSSNILYLLR